MVHSLNRSQKRLGELEENLKQNLSQKEEIDVLCEMAWELRMNEPEQSYAISEKSRQLSTSGEFENQPYTHGVAASLTNMAFVETYQGKLDQSVSKCMEAISLLNEGPLSATMADALYTLSWNNFFLGDYPAALEYGHKALNISRELGLKIHEAWALDAIASINGGSQNFEVALQTHRESLDLFIKLHDRDGELRTLNNLAYTHYLMKAYPEALEESLRSLTLAEKMNSRYQAFNICCTIAQILIDMRKWKKAEAYLKKAYVGLEKLDPTNVMQVYVLMEWGRLYLMKNDLQTAEFYFTEALTLAAQTERRLEQAMCHQRLSEVYEALSQYKKALKQYKAFHELRESVTGEHSAKQLAVLNTTYQVESAQHEREIYRLQTINLQREVEEQKKVQEILENLSRVDGLTGVFNRRYFDERLEEEYARHARSGAELSLIMLDADHFKAYNDTYGHIQGDDCLKLLAQTIKQTAFRPSDFTARYGGEEFACILPMTDSHGALVVAEKIREGVINLAIPHSASSTLNVVTISIGATTIRCHPGGSATELVKSADKQLYKAKSDGRNCVRAISKIE